LEKSDDFGESQPTFKISGPTFTKVVRLLEKWGWKFKKSSWKFKKRDGNYDFPSDFGQKLSGFFQFRATFEKAGRKIQKSVRKL
jgi:hypothetical protein